MKLPLYYYSIQSINDLYKSGELNPIDLTKSMLDRISSLDKSLNSFILITENDALIQAEIAKSEIDQGICKGPLHGIPIGLKDLCDMVGTATTAGSLARRDTFPEEDATVTKKLKDSGAIILGKLSMTEGAFVEHVKGMPEPKNPWNRDYETGLSSSGPAVSVASGLCFGSIGSDTGGSIRYPSIACGVTGLKPTWGRVSRKGIVPLAQSLDHVGPIGRSAQDVAAILGVIAGFDENDKTSNKSRVPDYLATIGLGIKGIRIGFDKNYCTKGVDVELSSSILKALDTFSDLGAQINHINIPPTDGLTPHFTDLVSVEASLSNGSLLESRSEDLGVIYKDLLKRGRNVSGLDYAILLENGRNFTGELNSIFTDIDILICPPWPSPAVSKLEDTIGDLDNQGSLLRFTAPYNVSNNPSITIPSGFNTLGIPLGLQIIGRHFEEDLLLRAAYSYQEVTNWHNRIPKDYS